MITPVNNEINLYMKKCFPFFEKSFIIIIIIIIIIVNVDFEIFIKTHVLLYFYKETRSSHRTCSLKKLFLKILQYLQENACVGVSF